MRSVLIVLPTYNEQLVIYQNTQRLLQFCEQNLCEYDWRVAVADNGSTDQTISEVGRITHPRFYSIHLSTKGRGGAIVKTWQNSTADFLMYMDSDLAVGLESIPALIQNLEIYDVVTASRFTHGSSVQRTPLRDVSSRIYMWMVRRALGYHGNDVQCGCKGIQKKVFETILPYINTASLTNNSGWFFDTELLVFAERKGYQIKELPVEWVDNRFAKRKSRVRVLPITVNYIRQVAALRKRVRNMQAKDDHLP